MEKVAPFFGPADFKEGAGKQQSLLFTKVHFIHHCLLRLVDRSLYAHLEACQVGQNPFAMLCCLSDARMPGAARVVSSAPDPCAILP